MKLYRSLSEFSRLDFGVATTGTFDGVHIGHRTILNKLVRLSKDYGGESVLLTFDPHPRQVLQPDTDLKLLSSIEEKIALLEEIGIDHLIVHPFTKEFSRTSSLEFVRNILVEQIGVKKLVIGYDHHFGRNREGSFEHLKEYGPLYGFDVEEIPAQDIDEVAISSTKIRNALGEGDMEKVNQYLGHVYSTDALVVKGDQIGRTIGYPTANCQILDPRKLWPGDGVYVVNVGLDDKRLQGMCNIGMRPTINGQPERRIEVHLFDFAEDIYDQNLSVFFLKKLRDVVKFEGLDQLKDQLKKDEVQSREYLSTL